MNDYTCILIWDAHTRMGHNIVPYAYGTIYAYGAEHIYTYTHMHTHVHTDTHRHTHSSQPLHTNMQIYLMHACTHSHRYTQSHTNTHTQTHTGVDPEFCKGGSWLMAMVYIVCSTMSMQSMLMLGGKFEKLDTQILNLVGFEHKV